MIRGLYKCRTCGQQKRLTFPRFLPPEYHERCACTAEPSGDNADLVEHDLLHEVDGPFDAVTS